jgi:hypothetical protein
MFLLDGLRQLLSSLMAFSLIRRVVKFGCSDLLSWQAIVLCLKLVVCDCLLGKVVVLTLVCLGCSDFSLPLNDFVQLVESQVGVRGVRAISFLAYFSFLFTEFEVLKRSALIMRRFLGTEH